MSNINTGSNVNTDTVKNKMIEQTPAEGIMLLNKWDNAKSFHIECSCGSEDHSAKMWIEVQKDTDIPEVEVSFYVTTWTPFWDSNFNRIKCAWDVLTKGVHRQEHHMILTKQAALNLAKVLEQTVNELDNQ